MMSNREKKGETDILVLWGVVLGMGIFEIVSGLAVSLVPGLYAGVEFGLISHVVIGIVFFLPLAIYLWSHYRFHRNSCQTRVIQFGYVTLLATLVCLGSGLWGACAAVFSDRVPYVVRFGHKWGSYLALILIILHSGYSWRRKRIRVEEVDASAWSGFWRAGRVQFWIWVCMGFGIPFWITSILAGDYHYPHYHNGLPPGYDLKYGPNPFAPSNAMTASGTILDWRRLPSSHSCKACHRRIYEEWKSSAHHWSGTDPAFGAVADMLAKKKDFAATRYCGGCHDPASLITGEYDKGVIGDPASSEGSSCVFCHGIHGISHGTKGNGNYIFFPPREYLFARSKNPLGEKINYFLIRAYPKAHHQDYGSPLEKNPKICSTCHKQYMDKRINGFGFVRLQNQYDDWLKGHYYNKNHPNKTLNCMDCHMRQVASNDPARNACGFIHSHRFIAANNAIPWLRHDLKQVTMTEQWLKGKTYVPEIESRWAKGAVARIQIDVPPVITPGHILHWDVNISNNKPGHSFPTGSLDLIEVWLDVTVKDASENVLYHSGFINNGGFVDRHAFSLRALGLDAHGKTITKHNIWDMVRQKTKRSIPVGSSETVPYKVEIPKECRGPLTVVARLRYRKFNQHFTDFMVSPRNRFFKGYSLQKGQFPITDISYDKRIVSIKRRTHKPLGK